MANNKSAFFVLLLAFLFLLTAPIVLVIGYYSGILPQFLIDLFAKKVMLPHIITAATAGLFVIPIIFVFLAAIIIVIKKRRRFVMPSAAVAKVAVAKPKVPARYAWEGMFGVEEREYGEKRRQVSRPYSANFKAAAAIVIVVALVVLVLLLANATKPASIADANKTAAVNVTSAETPSDVTVGKENVLSRILAQVFAAHNATNKTQTRQDAEEKPADEIKPQRNFTSVQLSAAAKKALDSIKSFGSKVKGKFVNSVSKAKSAVAKVPDVAWQKIAFAAVALLVIGTVFYSHRTSQLSEIPEWFREWLGWLAAIFAAARKNRMKVLLAIIFAAVACAAIAAVVFRRWLSAKFPSLSPLSFTDAAVNVLLAVRDFVSAYRLYILIGIFSLLAIIGILFVYETKGKKKGSQ